MGVTEIDIRLIRRAAKGDPEAFGTLYDQHHQGVYHYAYMLCGSAETAEDITQETFIRAYRNLNRLGPPYNVRAWLLRVAHNYYLNQQRRQNPEVPLDPEAPIAAPFPTPEGQIASREFSTGVRAALGRLSISQREALVLREIEGLPYEDIAEVLGISLDNVKVILHRARAGFKDHYAVRILAEDPRPLCEVLGDLLDSFEDGAALHHEQERLVREHIKECDICQQRKREIVAIALLLRGIQMPLPPGKLRDQVLDNTEPEKTSARRAARIAAVGGAGGLLVISIWIILWFISSSHLVSFDPPLGMGGGSDDLTPTALSTPFSVVSTPLNTPIVDPPISSENDPCMSNGGIQYQGTTCVCPGVVDNVIICQDGTKFDTPTTEECTPNIFCSGESGTSAGGGSQCACQYKCYVYDNNKKCLQGGFEDCNGNSCIP